MARFTTTLCLQEQEQCAASESQKEGTMWRGCQPGTMTSGKGRQTALGKKYLDLHSPLRKACGFMIYTEVRLLEHKTGCRVILQSKPKSLTLISYTSELTAGDLGLLQLVSEPGKCLHHACGVIPLCAPCVLKNSSQSSVCT